MTLRTGRRENATVQLMQALGRYVNVAIAAFLDDAVGEEPASQLELLAAVHNADVARIALRSHGFGLANRAAIAQISDKLLHAEGPPDGT